MHAAVDSKSYIGTRVSLQPLGLFISSTEFLLSSLGGGDPPPTKTIGALVAVVDKQQP